jgi:hypothetical protein
MIGAFCEAANGAEDKKLSLEEPELSAMDARFTAPHRPKRESEKETVRYAFYFRRKKRLCHDRRFREAAGTAEDKKRSLALHHNSL